MVAFLEKHFEFTTALSMDECVARLEAKSKRRSGWFASKRDILVRVSDDEGGKKFMLDRDWGRNLYAEVHGQLRKQADNTVYVSGFGRITLFNFLFMILFVFAICFIVYHFRDVPVFVVFGLLMGIMNLMFWLLIISNRNNLIYIVEQTLNDGTH